MVSDSDLVTRLREILRASDLDTATPGTVRRQLEQELGVDLSDRKAFIRDQIDIFLQTLGEGDEEESGEEGAENQNVKDEGDAVEDGEDEEVAAEENEEGEEEEEQSGGKVRTQRGSKKTGKGKKRGGGFCKPCSLSPQLQEFLGDSELARTEVVKKIWAYIRGNNLQDPKNKRNIICDEALQALFHVNTIDMFKMNKALSKHIWPLSDEKDKMKQKTKGEQSDHFASEEDTDNAVKEEEEEEEPEGEVDSNGSGSRKRGSAKANKVVKKRGGGFSKLCSLSPQLQTVTGVPEMARTEVVKRIWAYIREKDLQDPKNRRNIICDEPLRALFRCNTINMFQMNKALSKHIWPLNEDYGADNFSQKVKESEEENEESSGDEPKPKEKRQKKGGGSGLMAPLQLSDALVKFLGTGENALSRSDVVKRMWEYIKQNDLQDPSDKRRVLCDDKLKELLEVDSFHGFSVSKLLTPHFIKSD